MATRLLTRSLLNTAKKALSSSRSSYPIAKRTRPLSTFSLLLQLTAVSNIRRPSPAATTARGLATLKSTPPPPPPHSKEFLDDGCDFEHWRVLFGSSFADGLTRDEIIDTYIKTIAMVVGSEEEARMKLYSVWTKAFYGFGVLASKELAKKIEGLPGVGIVLPDCYLFPENKDYGGEPFINGQAVPFDPKHYALFPFACSPKPAVCGPWSTRSKSRNLEEPPPSNMGMRGMQSKGNEMEQGEVQS